jgi:hypothetical protein
MRSSKGGIPTGATCPGTTNEWGVRSGGQDVSRVYAPVYPGSQLPALAGGAQCEIAVGGFHLFPSIPTFESVFSSNPCGAFQ